MPVQKKLGKLAVRGSLPPGRSKIAEVSDLRKDLENVLREYQQAISELHVAVKELQEMQGE